MITQQQIDEMRTRLQNPTTKVGRLSFWNYLLTITPDLLDALEAAQTENERLRADADGWYNTRICASCGEQFVLQDDKWEGTHSLRCRR